MNVCAQTPPYAYCGIHGGFYTGPACPHCADAQRPNAAALRLNVQSQTIDHLLARQAELETAIAMLRRRVSELEHRTNDRQHAHNAAAAELLELRP
jgi:glutaredoxin